MAASDVARDRKCGHDLCHVLEQPDDLISLELYRPTCLCLVLTLALFGFLLLVSAFSVPRFLAV